MKLEGGFINNLSKVYGIYTLGFLGFVILMAILEQCSNWGAVSYHGIRAILRGRS
jgi:hypothetical protein